MAAASARLMAAPLTAAGGMLELSLDCAMIEPRIERTSGNERDAQPDAQAPPEYPSRRRYWPSFGTSQ
jgi:hypothetical protein